MARPPTDTIRFLTLEELARLFAAVRASPRDRALFLIAYRHGLRASEVGLLRTDDIDFRALRNHGASAQGQSFRCASDAAGRGQGVAGLPA
jgi:integrase